MSRLLRALAAAGKTKQDILLLLATRPGAWSSSTMHMPGPRRHVSERRPRELPLPSGSLVSRASFFGSRQRLAELLLAKQRVSFQALEGTGTPHRDAERSGAD